MASVSNRLTIPAKTTVEIPVFTTLYTGNPSILSVAVHFPDGCRGLVYVRFVSTYMVLTDWLRGDGREVVEMVNAQIEEPYTIIVQGYNEAIDWAHTVDVMAVYTRKRNLYGPG
jgi:hypothetical protein